MSHKLTVYTVDGRATEYPFDTIERRTAAVEFVGKVWKSQKRGTLTLSDPDGVATINTDHIVRMREHKP